MCPQTIFTGSMCLIKPTDMLRKLEPPVRPVVSVSSSPVVSQAIENMSFEEMISQANTGNMNTHAPVMLPDGLNLNENECAALSDAADRAHAAGSKHALILLGDYSLLLDVETRRIEKNITQDADPLPRIISNIDTAVLVNLEDKSTSNPDGKENNNITETISKLQFIPGHEQTQWAQAVMDLIKNQNCESSDLQTDNKPASKVNNDVTEWKTESSDVADDVN